MKCPIHNTCPFCKCTVETYVAPCDHLWDKLTEVQEDYSKEQCAEIADALQTSTVTTALAKVKMARMKPVKRTLTVFCKKCLEVKTVQL